MIERDPSKQIEHDEFIINKAYQCQIILTNVCPIQKEVTLSYQVPNGSLPLLKSKYASTKFVQVEAYTTKKVDIQFYFPFKGKFQHEQSNISLNGVVIMKSPKKFIEVGKKKTIKKVETFQDLMMTTNGMNQKKQKVLDLLETKEDIFVDHKFNFTLDECAHLTKQDSQFLM